MKKSRLLTYIILCAFGLFSCSDEIGHKISGQWQLKTIEENGVVSQVDTVFYSFQRACIFAFTVVLPNDENNANISYGYMETPSSDDEIFIAMDTTRRDDGSLKNIVWNFKALSGWSEYYNRFKVESYTGKKLILSSEGKIYSFKKH